MQQKYVFLNKHIKRYVTPLCPYPRLSNSSYAWIIVVWSGLLKREYKDNQTYLNEKQNLFQNLTYMMIEKELNHNDIDIKHEEVMDYYKKCEDIDETIAFFDEKYDQQLDKLGEKEEMFDDDALVFYIVKVIEHFVDIHQIPDKNYIASDLLELIQKDHDYHDLLEQTQSIMKRLIKMKHEKNQDLQNTFSPYGIDLEQFFTRVFQEIDYIEHQVSFLKKIYSLLKELQNEYALSLRYVEIRMDVLSTLTKYTQENLDEEIKDTFIINKKNTLRTNKYIIISELEPKNITRISKRRFQTDKSLYLDSLLYSASLGYSNNSYLIVKRKIAGSVFLLNVEMPSVFGF